MTDKSIFCKSGRRSAALLERFRNRINTDYQVAIFARVGLPAEIEPALFKLRVLCALTITPPGLNPILNYFFSQGGKTKRRGMRITPNTPYGLTAS